MRLPTPLLLAMPLAAVAACAPKADDPCGAVAYAGLVGSPLAAVTLPAGLNDRVVGPDTAVTMDLDPTRLNIEVDASGTITGLSCG
ncbi:hypothetical protein JQC91_03965 [Jannaschia sp. Os4]|uniref:I78 family peptidase inhibitor n=1 Tax=Jannaschia sp. Os4 TaxID=2807617 RepID=UPI00193A1926|nr:I78 family peptidase inhibitor [Jannaschia sp. Os4]MBM2575451.1 hypothetical protein [Jannaschia sp. Os4]